MKELIEEQQHQFDLWNNSKTAKDDELQDLKIRNIEITEKLEQ